MKRAIITGGSGFLGSRVIKALLSSEVELLLIEHKTPLARHGKFRLVKGGTSAITAKLIDDFKPDVIFHCARPTLPRFKRTGRIIAAKKAARINLKLLRQIEKAKTNPKLVFASGSLMYGNSPEPHNELAELNPISYARQYYKGELPIILAIPKSKATILVLRFPWLLGNGSWFKWFFLESIKKHHAIAGIGSMENHMEIVDADDASQLMIEYADKVDESGIYNIFSETAVSQELFIKTTASIFGVPVKTYDQIFGRSQEQEAEEAFTSNILLTSNFMDILSKFQFKSLKESLLKIKEEA